MGLKESPPSFGANDLNTGLRELRELAEKATLGTVVCSPSLLLALTEVAAKAAEYRLMMQRLGAPAGPLPAPADLDRARLALDAALARLSVCFSDAQPNNEEGE